MSSATTATNEISEGIMIDDDNVMNEGNDALHPLLKFDGCVRALLFDWMTRRFILFQIDGRQGLVTMERDRFHLPDMTKLKNILWYELPQCGVYPLVCVLKCDEINAPIVFLANTLTAAEQYHLVPRQITMPEKTSFHNWHTTAQMLLWREMRFMSL